MKNFLITVALCVISLATFSQSEFRKGFIIIHEKDTVYGQVDFRDGARAFDACRFRQSPGDEARIYTPDDISGYGFIDGRHFDTQSGSSVNDTQKFFYEVLVGGTVTLFKYHDTFFVNKDGGALIELRNEGKTKEVNGTAYFSYSNEFIGTLNTLMADCPNLWKAVEKTKLLQRSLIEITERYNRCRNTEAVVHNAKMPWLRAVPGIVGGMEVSFPKFQGDFMYSGNHLVSKKPATSVMIGMSLDLSSPRISERLTFTTSLIYIPVTYHLSTTKSQPTADYFTIGIHELKIPFGIRYAFASRKVTTYIMGGLSDTRS